MMAVLLDALRLAMSSILRAKLRASLTVLGILIGVAAVVIVISLGAGVRARVLNEVESLGANVIYIFPQSTRASGVRGESRGRLTEDDGEAIARDAPSVAFVAPFSDARSQVIAGDRNVSTLVMGVTTPYWKVRAFEFDKGSSWDASDETAKAKVCVLGKTVSDELFGSQNPVGEFVRIDRHTYRVIGLLKAKGASPFGSDQDDRVLVPMGSFRARVLPSSPGQVQLLIASAADANRVDRASTQIDSILRQRHRISPSDKPDFAIRTQAEFRRTQEGIFDALTVLLLSIAAVSLVVGGIGVMNIMLVSVAQRTREIGIRLAIGARQRQIMFQFLVESVTLSLIGGALGIGLGVGATYALVAALDWTMVVPPETIPLAVGMSATVGVLFGYLPARRAARLDPIVALRHEG